MASPSSRSSSLDFKAFLITDYDCRWVLMFRDAFWRKRTRHVRTPSRPMVPNFLAILRPSGRTVPGLLTEPSALRRGPNSSVAAAQACPPFKDDAPCVSGQSPLFQHWSPPYQASSRTAASEEVRYLDLCWVHAV
jgi:hypothetical protein